MHALYLFKISERHVRFTNVGDEFLLLLLVFPELAAFPGLRLNLEEQILGRLLCIEKAAQLLKA